MRLLHGQIVFYSQDAFKESKAAHCRRGIAGMRAADSLPMGGLCIMPECETWDGGKARRTVRYPEEQPFRGSDSEISSRRQSQ